MEGIEHKTVFVNGINMHVAEKGEGPKTILFVHGFPELWYSWRYQIQALSDSGYRCIAPDLRGYGDSDVPSDTASYSIFHLVGDLVGLLDALSLNQEPGSAEAEFAAVETSILMKGILSGRGSSPFLIRRGVFAKAIAARPVELPSWLSEEDIQYYATKFNKTGFTGGINYYRNLKSNWELTAAWTNAKVKVPTKFVVGDVDLTYSMPGVKGYIHDGEFKRDVPLLQDEVIMEGVAHFCNQEKPMKSMPIFRTSLPHFKFFILF